MLLKTFQHIGVPVILLLFICPLFAQEQWKQVYKDGDIVVFTRHISGLAFKQLRIETRFYCAPATFLSLIRDIEAQPKYIYGCLLASNIKDVNVCEHIFYQHLYMPWPFQDRDGFFDQRITTDSINGQIDITTIAVGNYQPEVKNYVRIRNMRSHWHLTRLQNGISAEYELGVDPGGNVPAWLVNMFIKDAPVKTVRNMRTLLQLNKYNQQTVKKN